MFKLFRIITLAIIIGISSAFQSNAAQAKMHIVVFGDTGDASIGSAVGTDINLFDRLTHDIQQAVQSEGVKCSIYKFVGSKCSPSNLNSFFNDFACEGDIVLFYYNGHGGRSHSDKSKFPRMCLGSHYANEWVKISDLIEKIKSKNPRLQVLITDCCNSYYDRKGIQDYQSAPSDSKGSGAGLKKLFLKSTGSMCITAASPGEYGWCTTAGSYMTLEALSAFKAMDEQGESATWDKLFKMISDATYQKTRELYNRRAISNSQRPVYEVNSSGNAVDDRRDDNNGDNNGGNGDNGDNGDNNGNNDRDNDRDNGDNDRDGNDGNDGNDGGSRYDDADNEEEDGSSSGIGALFLIALGLIFIVKVPAWFNLTGMPALVVRVIGILFILNTLLAFLY